MTSRVADVIAQDAGIQLTGDRPQLPAQPSGQPERTAVWKQMLILGVILLIVLMTPLRNVLFWMLLFGRGGGGVEAATAGVAVLAAVAAASEDLAEAAPAAAAPAEAGEDLVAPASCRLSRGHLALGD